VDQQKLFLGERLYPVIAVDQPQLAGKITGMFLDAGWDIEELYSLLTIPEKLNDRVEEAINVLERASQTVEPEASTTTRAAESGI
jgi:polyadenylate-binding protein